MTLAGGEGTETVLTRQEAQRRAEQVAAFRRELQELERVGVAGIGAAERERIERYHGQLLAALARQFDVDGSEARRRMSLGMRTASLLGAVTLSAAVVLFFYRIWGLLGTAAQVAVLAGMPLLALAAVDVAARREKTLYVASVLALIAGAAFMLDLSALGAIFNMAPTPWVLLPWAAFALALAYGYGLALMLAAGLVLGLGFVNALVAAANGIDWASAVGRPEPLVLLGGLVFIGAFTRLASPHERFPETWRLVGSAAVLLPIFFLSVWPEVFSYRLLPVSGLHALYDTAGFVLPIAAVLAGIRWQWPEVLRVSTTFLVLFVYAKCFDWWWDAMPRYLFFLLLGGLAVGTLVLLGRLRRRLKAV